VGTIASKTLIPIFQDTGEWPNMPYVGLCVFAWYQFNPLNAELNPICHLLALLGTHHILHVNRIRVKYPCYVRKTQALKR